MTLSPLAGLAALAVTIAPFAIAAGDDRPPPRRPPQAAFDACANAARGDRCSLTHDDHTITGTCEAVPDSQALACRPDHPPPPPEAVQACASAKAGDACSFAHADRSISGTCAKGPDANAPLACRPAHPKAPR